MRRLGRWSMTGALTLAAACGVNPVTDAGDGSRDAVTQDAARSDAANDGGDLDTGSTTDGASDLDVVTADTGPNQDTGVAIDVPMSGDSGTLTDVTTPPDATDASSLTCTAPRADCDHNAANGCEASLMTDAANCGACGRSCGSAACNAGLCAPETVVGGLTVPVNDIALDDTNVYWFSADPTSMTTSMGQILRVPKSGGARATVVSGLGNGEAGLQYHDGFLYYGTLRAPSTLAMERVAVTGGARTVLTQWTPNYGTYAVGTTRLYATDHCFGGDPICTTGRESIVRLPNDGTGNGTVVLANRPGALVFGVDGTYVYFSVITDLSNVPINRVPIAGGTVEVLASNQTAAYVPTLGPDGYVYWPNVCSSSAPGAIMRIRPGMTSPQRLVTDVGCPHEVLSDGVDVYWGGTNMARARYTIRHLHIGDSTADTMLDTATVAGNIRIDATHVYYVSGTSGDSIRRVPR